MAPAGHCNWHAKHWMHVSSLAGSALRCERGCPGVSTMSYSDTGQTSAQTPSPTQESQSTATEVPWIPSLAGGSTGPQTLCPLCSETTWRLSIKLGSIGKNSSPFNSRRRRNIRVSTVHSIHVSFRGSTHARV